MISNDPSSLSDAVPNYLQAIGKGIKGLRIGFDEAYAREGVAPHMADAVRQAVRVLERVGARITAMQMPWIEEG